jgi:hypothetical protein
MQIETNGYGRLLHGQSRRVECTFDGLNRDRLAYTMNLVCFRYERPENER